MAARSYIFFLMILRPPRSTRTDTLFPYTTLFRSFTSQAIVHFWSDASKRVIVPAPDFPASRLVQQVSTSAPSGVTKPSPVTTIRRIVIPFVGPCPRKGPHQIRSEEHTSELQSLMRISYAVFCLKKKKQQNVNTNT